MSAASQTTPSRVTGVASAVLLVLLLATSGWPADAPRIADEQQVACCEVVRLNVWCNAAESEERASGATVAIVAGAPRIAPRCARVDSWGLPPPRAPTSARR